MDIPFITEIIHWFALGFGIIGSAMVIYGGIRAAIELIRSKFNPQVYKMNAIKREFTGHIVFGLEFFIAGDILTSVLNPTIEDLTLLGAVVLIRVILGYFLEKEAKEFDIG
ncbi:MAG: DUF1622 domain-containing protein [Methanomicrobiales archaeon]|nr:DUF1622 domain-containing protein [Methanomicrobiales archaeon]